MLRLLSALFVLAPAAFVTTEAASTLPTSVGECSAQLAGSWTKHICGNVTIRTNAHVCVDVLENGRTIVSIPANHQWCGRLDGNYTFSANADFRGASDVVGGVNVQWGACGHMEIRHNN